MRQKFLNLFAIAIFFIGLFGLAEGSFAGDLYFGQNSAGNNNGADCVNHRALSTLTWGDGHDIKAGDTLHLCGNISSPLVIGASGTAGNSIMIKFEDGTKFSVPHWNQSGINDDAAIYANAKDYITIDGGVNGFIEATDNGTSKTYQLNSQGIVFSSCNNGEIRNLTIQKLYVRDAGADDGRQYGYGIDATDSSNLLIHDNIINNAFQGISYSYTQAANSVNVNIYNNLISDTGIDISIGSGNANATLDSMSVYSNRLSLGTNWGGYVTSISDHHHHQDGIHIYAAHNSTQITNLKIYANSIGPSNSTWRLSGQTLTNASSWIFVEANVGTIVSPQVYNNILFVTSGPGIGPGDGLVYFKGFCTTPKAYNNTFSTDTLGQTGLTLAAGNGNTNADFKNNLFNNIYDPIYLGTSDDTVSISDYNLFYPVSGLEFYDRGSFRDLQRWKTAHSGFEPNSQTGNPYLDVNHKPTSGSLAIDKGFALGSSWAVDAAGVSRPQGSAWDIGAYEYIGNTDTIPPAAPTGLAIR